MSDDDGFDEVNLTQRDTVLIPLKQLALSVAPTSADLPVGPAGSRSSVEDASPAGSSSVLSRANDRLSPNEDLANSVATKFGQDIGHSAFYAKRKLEHTNQSIKSFWQNFKLSYDKSKLHYSYDLPDSVLAQVVAQCSIDA